MSRLIRYVLLSSGGVPAISVSPSSWDYGSTPVGTPVSKEFTIENTGTAALEITLPITSPAGFTVTVDPATSIAPGASTTFTVEADADSVDVFSGNLEIVSNAASSPTLVAIEVEVSATLYADEFTGASAVNGNADVRGYRVFNDVEGLMTQSAGALNVPAQASAAWGDEYYRAQPSVGQQYWTRPSGKALVAVVDFRHSVRSEQMPVGWWNDPILDGSVAKVEAAGYTVSNSSRTRIGNTAVSDTQTYSADTDYPSVAVWDSTGFHTFVKISGVWHRKWFKPAVVTQAYCGMSNLSSAGSLKYFRIYAIDESLFAPALSVTAPSVGNLANMPDGDFLLYLDNITLPSASTLRLHMRKKDASNYWQERVSNTGAFDILEVVAASGTSRISASGVVSTDDITTIARGATMQAWRNTTALGSAYTSAYNFLREIGLELNAVNGGAIGNLYAWKARLLDETGLGAELVVDGTMSSSVANWPAAGTPTVREYTGGRLHIVTDAGSEGARQNIGGLTVGRYYQLTFGYEVVSGGLWARYLNGYENTNITGTGTVNLGFVATATSANLDFLAYVTGASEFYIDNVSMKEITFTADALALVLDGLAA